MEWNASDQPPEFWNQFKTDFAPGTHIRIHPLLHWTELNVWEYIERENIPGHPAVLRRRDRASVPLARLRAVHGLDPVDREDRRRDRQRAESDERCPSAPGAPRIRRAKTRLRSSGATATCDGLRAEPAQPRRRRPRRPRQINAHRPAVLRHRLAARWQIRAARRDRAAPRRAVRVRQPHGRAAGRARPEHHDRHEPDLVPHRRSANTSSSTRPATRNSSRTW